LSEKQQFRFPATEIYSGLGEKKEHERENRKQEEGEQGENKMKGKKWGDYPTYF